MLTSILLFRAGRCWQPYAWRMLLLTAGLAVLGACKRDEDINDKPAPVVPKTDVCSPIMLTPNPNGNMFPPSRGTFPICNWPLVEPVPGGRYLHLRITPDATKPYPFPVYSAAGQLLNTLHLDAFDPSVSAQGWLTYWDLSGQIWEIKLNGDSLTRLRSPTGAFNTYPRWLPDGRHLVVNRRYDNSSTYYQMLLLTASGGIVRVLADSRFGDLYMPGTSAFSPDGQRMVSVGGLHGQPLYELRAFDMQTKQLSVLAAIVPDPGQERETGIQDVTWAHAANVIFWTYGADIYRTDVSTNQTRKIVDGCYNSRYEYVSAAPDASYLLASRFEQHPLGSDSLLVDQSVWKITGDGSSMTQLP